MTHLALDPRAQNGDLLTTRQVADWLGVAPSTIAWFRNSGEGPAYSRLSARNIRYRREDVEAWMNERRQD